MPSRRENPIQRSFFDEAREMCHDDDEPVVYSLPCGPREDETPLTADQQALVVGVDRWVRKQAGQWADMLAGHKKQYRRSIYDDLYMEAIRQVMRAARRYDPTLGVKFTSYIAWYIRRGFQNATKNATQISPSFANGDGKRRIRANEERSGRDDEVREQDQTAVAQRAVSIHAMDDDGCDSQMVAQLSTPDNTSVEAEASDFWSKIDRLLPWRQAMALRMRFCQEASDEEIARACRIRGHRVKDLISIAVGRLRASRMMGQISLSIRPTERDRLAEVSKKSKRRSSDGRS